MSSSFYTGQLNTSRNQTQVPNQAVDNQAQVEQGSTSNLHNKNSNLQPGDLNKSKGRNYNTLRSNSKTAMMLTQQTREKILQKRVKVPSPTVKAEFDDVRERFIHPSNPFDGHLSKDELLSGNPKSKFTALQRFGKLKTVADVDSSVEKIKLEDGTHLYEQQGYEKTQKKGVHTQEIEDVRKKKRFLYDYYSNLTKGRITQHQNSREWRENEVDNMNRGVIGTGLKKIKDWLTGAKKEHEFGRKADSTIQDKSLAQRLLTPRLTGVYPYVVDRALKERGYDIDSVGNKAQGLIGDDSKKGKIADGIRSALIAARKQALKEVSGKMGDRLAPAISEADEQLDPEEQHVLNVSKKLSGAEDNTLELHTIGEKALEQGLKKLREQLGDTLNSAEMHKLEEDFKGWIKDYNQEASVEVSRLRTVRENFNRTGILPIGSQFAGLSKDDIDKVDEYAWKKADDVKWKAAWHRMSKILPWNWGRGNEIDAEADRIEMDAVKQGYREALSKLDQYSTNYIAAREWIMYQYDMNDTDEAYMGYMRYEKKQAPADPAHWLAIFGQAENEEEIISAIEDQIRISIDSQYSDQDLENVASKKPAGYLATFDDLTNFRNQDVDPASKHAQQIYIRNQAEAIYRGIRDGLLESAIDQAEKVHTQGHMARQALYLDRALGNMANASDGVDKYLNRMATQSNDRDRLAKYKAIKPKVENFFPVLQETRDVVAKGQEVGDDAAVDIDFQGKNLKVTPETRQQLESYLGMYKDHFDGAMKTAEVVDRVLGNSNASDKRGIIDIDRELGSMLLAPRMHDKNDFNKMRDEVQQLRKEVLAAKLGDKPISRPGAEKSLLRNLEQLDKRIDLFEELFQNFQDYDKFIENPTPQYLQTARQHLSTLKEVAEDFMFGLDGAGTTDDLADVGQQIRDNVAYYHKALTNTIAFADAQEATQTAANQLSEKVAQKEISLEDALAQFHLSSQNLVNYCNVPTDDSSVSSHVINKSQKLLDAGVGQILAAATNVQNRPAGFDQMAVLLERSGVLDSRTAAAIDKWAGGKDRTKKLADLAHLLTSGNANSIDQVANQLFEDNPDQILRFQSQVIRQTMVDQNAPEVAIDEALAGLTRNYCKTEAANLIAQAAKSDKVKTLFNQAGAKIGDKTPQADLLDGLSSVGDLIGKVYGTPAKEFQQAASALQKLLAGNPLLNEHISDANDDEETPPPPQFDMEPEISAEDAEMALKLARQIAGIQQGRVEHDQGRVDRLTRGLNYSLGIPDNATKDQQKAAAIRHLSVKNVDPQLGDINTRLQKNYQQIDSQLAAASMVHGKFVESFKEAAPLIGAKADAKDPQLELAKHGRTMKTLNKMVQLQQINEDIKDFSPSSHRHEAASKEMVQLAQELKDKNLDHIHKQGRFSEFVDSLLNVLEPNAIKDENEASIQADKFQQQNLSGGGKLDAYKQMIASMRTIDALNQSTDQIKQHVQDISKEHTSLMDDVRQHRAEQFMAKVVLEEFSASGKDLDGFTLDNNAEQRVRARLSDLGMDSLWESFKKSNFEASNGKITDDFLKRFESSSGLPPQLQSRVDHLNEQLNYLGRLSQTIGNVTKTHNEMLQQIDGAEMKEVQQVQPPNVPELSPEQTFGDAFPTLKTLLMDGTMKSNRAGGQVIKGKVGQRLKAFDRERKVDRKQEAHVFRSICAQNGVPPEELMNLPMSEGLRQFGRIIGNAYGAQSDQVQKEVMSLQNRVNDVSNRERQLREAENMRKACPYLGNVVDVSALEMKAVNAPADSAAPFVSDVNSALNNDMPAVNSTFNENLKKMAV